MKQKPEIQLVRFFCRNGCLRLRDKERQEEEGSMKYKKGYEVRLVAKSEEELKLISSLLVKAGFKPGKPYQKNSQFVQPVYGKKAVEKFYMLFLKIISDQ